MIGIHSDKKGRSFPGESTIGILSGLSDKTVRRGIQGLMGFGDFQLSYRVNEKGKRAKCYRLALPPRGEKKRAIFFHRCIVEGGNWAELKQSSHAVYPVMRCFSYFNQEDGEEPAEKTGEGFRFLYQSREWETCEVPISILARYAGISRPSIYEALNDLEKHSLIESRGTNDEGVRTWRVFLIPPKYYKREYLNMKIRQNHGGSEV